MPESKEASWDQTWQMYVDYWGKEEAERRRAEQFKQPPPDEDSLSELDRDLSLASLKISAGARYTGRRAGSQYGVGASGRAVVLENPLGESEFFTPGNTFKLTIRHSNSRDWDDDAIMCGYGAAINLVPESDSVNSSKPLDLIMLTGELGLFQNLPSFIDAMKCLNNEITQEEIEPWLMERPINFRGVSTATRRAPDSYTLLYYFSRVTYVLHFPGEKPPYLVRFRIQPKDLIGKEESGLPSEEDQRYPYRHWKRTDDEKRAKTYLRDQYKEDVTKAKVEYLLQVQYREYTPQTSPDTAYDERFNIGEIWGENYAWVDLMKLETDTVLPDEITEKLCFNMANRPECLRIPEPKSKWDYNAIPYAREAIYRASQEGRGALKQ